LTAVATAYVFQRPDIFRKKQDGSIPFYIRWLFIPFLCGVQLYNTWARKNDSVPAIQKIDNNLFLASRLFLSEMPELHQHGIKAILDVTAEFDGLDWSASGENQLN
jgi:diacylglycerol kinase (ATP)